MESGIFALSDPGRLAEVLDTAGLVAQEDDEIETPIRFDDVDVAVRAFMGAGPTAIAISHSGEPAVAHALREGLGPFTGPNGLVGAHIADLRRGAS